MATVTYGYPGTQDEQAAIQREALVLQHLPQVRLIARRIHQRLPSYVALDDLIAPGVVGLLEAIDNFDPSLNVQLKTYAERRIRGAILDSLREIDWVPRDVRKKSRLVESVITQLKQSLGREPGGEEIAASLNISDDEYQKWLSELQHIELERLEKVESEDQGRALIHVLSDDESSWPSTILERSELERILALGGRARGSGRDDSGRPTLKRRPQTTNGDDAGGSETPNRPVLRRRDDSQSGDQTGDPQQQNSTQQSESPTKPAEQQADPSGKPTLRRRPDSNN